MLVFKAFLAMVATVLGLINTGFWFCLAVMVPCLTGHQHNWPAKGWAWVAHWLIYRPLRVKLQVEFHGAAIAPNEQFVVFGNHPPTPGLSEWVYAVSQTFWGFFFSPVGRSSHRLARGFGGIGAVVIDREAGDLAVQQLQDQAVVRPQRTVVTIFSDETRFTPARHAAAWGEIARKGRLHLYGRHKFTLPPRGRGTFALAQALPNASWVRCTVAFNRPIHLVWNTWRLPGATLLIRFDRVERPPVQEGEFYTWLNGHFALIDQIMEEHQET